MNKSAYIDRLETLLQCLPKDKRAEVVSFYGEAIEDRIEDGMSEEDAVAAMGSVEIVAETILAELPVVPRVVAKTKRKSLVLLWVLAILGCPVWVPLAAAFLVTTVAVYLCIWIVAACVWLLAALLVLALPLGIFLAWCGIVAGLPAFALAQTGVGMMVCGIGLLVFRLAFSSSRWLAALSQKWARKAMSPFRRCDGVALGDTAAA